MVKVNLSILQSVDLNHLRALHILLEESNVGRAAVRLNITPPAASNALRRLRELFNDELLVRSGRSMVRTTLGNALHAPAADFVRAAERLLDTPAQSFSAEVWRGTFTLMTSDFVYLTLARPLERLLRTRAPGLDLKLVATVEDSAAWLRQHEGLAIEPFDVPDNDILSEPLFHDTMVLAVHKQHSLSQKKPTLAHYCAQRHVLVAPRGQPGSTVDSLLHKRGLARRVTHVVPTHTLAAQIVACSDCVAILPKRFVLEMCQHFGLVARPLPFESERFDFRMSWHRRHDASPIHIFMRTLLQCAAAAPIVGG